MVESCFISFRSREEYDALAEYFDKLGFIWGTNQKLTDWRPFNMDNNCLEVDPTSHGNRIYQTCSIPSNPYEFHLPIISAAEFLGLNEKFNDSIPFEAVMGL